MTNLESTFFNVELTPVPHPIDNEDTKYRYVMNTDTSEVLSIVTKDYTLVKNEDLINAITPAIKEHNGKLIEAKLFGDGARTQYKYQFQEHTVTIHGMDRLVPEIVIKNSYDGTIAVTVMAGAFRLVCSNGMVIGQIVDYFKNRHLTDVQISKLNGIINDTIERTIKYLSEEVAQLAEIKPVKEKHLLEVIQMFPDRMMERAMEYITQHKPKDYWDLLNTATNIATHHMNRDAESTHNLEKRFLPRVMKMAELK